MKRTIKDIQQDIANKEDAIADLECERDAINDEISNCEDELYVLESELFDLQDAQAESLEQAD